MPPFRRTTLEDVLACWRAVIQAGAVGDLTHAAELTTAIARDSEFFRHTPRAAPNGDRSIASSADRFRARAHNRSAAPTSLSNAEELGVLATVAAALSSLISTADAECVRPSK